MVTGTVKLQDTLGRGNGRAFWKRSTVRQAHSEKTVCNLGRKNSPTRRQRQGQKNTKQQQQKTSFIDTEMTEVEKHSRKGTESD